MRDAIAKAKPSLYTLQLLSESTGLSLDVLINGKDFPSELFILKFSALFCERCSHLSDERLEEVINHLIGIIDVFREEAK